MKTTTTSLVPLNSSRSTLHLLGGPASIILVFLRVLGSIAPLCRRRLRCPPRRSFSSSTKLKFLF